MNINDLTFTLILIIIGSFSSYATEQAPDRLITGKDTLLLHALPLEPWKKQHDWDKPFFPDSLYNMNTGCWRGYIAHWELKNNRLYLAGIFNCDQSASADLTILFPGKVKDGRVYADWFSGTVTAYKGNLIYYEHSGFSAIYEHEFELAFAKGRKTSDAYFDNSLSKNTRMRWSDLAPAIDSLINWSALPAIDEEIKLVLLAKTNERGQPDSVQILTPHSEPFNQEALRVLGLLTPRFPIVYKRGKFLPRPYVLSFRFTPEKQQRYRSRDRPSPQR